jgi:hypothetical protein
MSETDNFSHRAGYADDPLAVAVRYARKGGTLAAGEGLLLVQEIERLTARAEQAEARAERAEAVLAKLREPSAAVLLAAVRLTTARTVRGFWKKAFNASIAAAEKENA